MILIKTLQWKGATQKLSSSYKGGVKLIIFNYLLMCFIFGTTFLAIKVGVDAGLPPFLSAGVRFFLAGLILFCWMLWRKKAKLSLLLKKEMLLTGLGLTFGTFAALYWSEQYVSSGIAAILTATGPIMILLLQTFLLRKTSSVPSIIGCILGFIGVIFLLIPNMYVNMSLSWLVGCLIILVGEIFYASGTLYSKHTSQRFSNVSPIALNAAQMMYGGILLFILSLCTEHIDIRSLGSWNAVGSLLYLSIVGSMIAQSIYYWLVIKTNPIFPSTWLYISPLLALTFGIFFYHEKIVWLSLIGVITIIIGVLLVNSNTLRQALRKAKKNKGDNPEGKMVHSR